jgi:hypothetical protein
MSRKSSETWGTHLSVAGMPAEFDVTRNIIRSAQRELNGERRLYGGAGIRKKKRSSANFEAEGAPLKIQFFLELEAGKEDT